MRADTTPTREYEMVWLAPVERPEDLPRLAADGQLCFVKSVDLVFVFDGGSWRIAR